MFVQKRLTLCLIGLTLWMMSQCKPAQISTIRGESIGIVLSPEQDPELQSLVEKYRKGMEAEMGIVIGNSNVALTNSLKGETALGNFVADVQKTVAEELLGKPIAISVINNGGLRNSLPKGPITVGNIYELSPFDNYLMILEMRAADILNLAKYVAINQNLGIRGITITSENGEVKSLEVNGEQPNENEIYYLAVNDYLASGGDNMQFLQNLNRKETYDLLLRDMLIEHIRELQAKGESINSQIEGRQIHK
jgi:2',3'-cyclic-nucleotide 2'-phosphodiesterase (5'-nucleotidase family)